MSTQPPLTAFADGDRESQDSTAVSHDEGFEGAAYRPDLREHPATSTDSIEPADSCGRCGQAVSPDYARVMCDSEGMVHACPRCPDIDRAQLHRGLATGRERSAGGARL